MITGDQGATARAIGDQVGLQGSAGALTGQELDTLDDGPLDERLGAVDVYALVTPEHKLFNARYITAPVLNRLGILGSP